ncbi:hypothetical protein V6N11_060146 [Hibiscus sabdariffa]|uniref:Uncharacterized protein n=1 Tax=Hibiscus sabdariffa TaxID=183260 RepID=A0ABR2P313_9ROSI
MGLRLGSGIGRAIAIDHKVEGGNLGEFLRIRVEPVDLDTTKLQYGAWLRVGTQQPQFGPRKRQGIEFFPSTSTQQSFDPPPPPTDPVSGSLPPPGNLKATTSVPVSEPVEDKKNLSSEDAAASAPQTSLDPDPAFDLSPVVLAVSMTEGPTRMSKHTIHGKYEVYNPILPKRQRTSAANASSLGTTTSETLDNAGKSSLNSPTVVAGQPHRAQ